TVRRHNKVMRKESEYRYRQCGQLLSFSPGAISER
ncbi:SprT family protein, partial [Hafnia alvei]